MTSTSQETPHADRLPPIPVADMDAAQRNAAASLIAGPRKAVVGPFIPLMRSPELLGRLQKVGEYLRFDSAVPAHLSEFATLLVARLWTQQFEWSVHVPLARKAGISDDTIEALRNGQRPVAMSAQESVIHDFTLELQNHRGVGDATYQRALALLGERGLVDLIGIIGYFGLVNMVLNVAHTPPTPVDGVLPLPGLPR